jgi:deoxyribodipyrimidine photo-lyase
MKRCYIRQWIPEFELGYGKPMVDHALQEKELLQRIKHSKVIY